MMFKDFYSILDIPCTTDKNEIKSAYRKQAIKWHPDKNPGVDTTKRMQEINEAKLILLDDEAKERFDREYNKFYQYVRDKAASQSRNQEHTRQEKAQPKYEPEQHTNREKENNSTTQEDFSNYTFDDEILKRWMENARKQAAENVKSMIIEFQESTIRGFGSFFTNALKAIVVSIIMYIIYFIITKIHL
jgi:DnaJ-class molecular chaperone